MLIIAIISVFFGVGYLIFRSAKFDFSGTTVAITLFLIPIVAGAVISYGNDVIFNYLFEQSTLWIYPIVIFYIALAVLWAIFILHWWPKMEKKQHEARMQEIERKHKEEEERLLGIRDAIQQKIDDGLSLSECIQLFLDRKVILRLRNDIVHDFAKILRDNNVEWGTQGWQVNLSWEYTVGRSRDDVNNPSYAFISNECVNGREFKMICVAEKDYIPTFLRQAHIVDLRPLILRDF